MKKFTFGIVLSIIFVLTGTVNAQISTFPYAESFEAGAGGWATDAGPNDTWALGAPAATVINSASDGTQAWVTNLTGLYNASSSASIVSPVFDFSALGADPTLKMDVWWEAEFSWDGARVQTSVDGGANWTRLGSAGDPLNWYNDTSVLGDHAWTGRNGSGSGGWVEAEHALDGLAGESSVILRVFFGSDSSGQDDGFAFDNVRITTIIGAEPVIACPADVMINTTGGLCTGVPNWAAPIVFDAEDGPLTATQIGGPMTGSPVAPGAYVVTYEATDSDGNTVDCSFNLTVADMEAPVAVCQDISLDLDAAGSVTITAADLDGGSSDNCGIVSSTMSTGVAASGTLDTGFAANNAAAGNMFNVMAINPLTINSFDINVNDAPAAVHNYEVYFKVGSWIGSEATPGDWTLVASPAGIVNVGFDMPTPLNLSLGINVAAGETVAFYITASDGSTLAYTNGIGVGNLWASDANMEFYEGAGKGYPFGATFAPRVFNGNIQYETGEVPFSGTFDCSNLGGANVINVTHTDAAGNSTTCQATVTISDVTAPAVTCIGQPLNGPNTVTDAPLSAIPDNDPTGLTSIITLTDDFVITDLNVDIDITHTWVGDVIVTITAPTGESATIIDRMGYAGTGFGCSSNNLLVTLDDEAALPIEDVCDVGPPAASGSYQPNNALSVFDGVSTLGDWIITVTDNAGGDIGTLNSWGITYDFSVVAAPLEIILDANGMASMNAIDLLLSVDEACSFVSTVGGPANAMPINECGDNLGAAIDSNLPPAESAAAVAESGSIGSEYDLDTVAIEITHTFDDDLTIELVSPMGTSLMLSDRNGGGGDNYTGTVFQDGGGDITAGVAPFTGIFEPQGGTFASTFAGEDVNGDWVLVVTDNAGGDVGTLDNFCITFNAIVATTIDFDCSNLGDNLVEVFVTDGSGNVASCMATVRVLDETAPILVCADVTLELGPDGTATVDPLALLGTAVGTFEVITISSDNQSGTEGFTDLTVPITDAADITFDWNFTTADGAAFDSFGYLLNGTYTILIDEAGPLEQSGSAGPISVVPGDVFGFRAQSFDGLFGPATTVISNFMPGFTGQFVPANWTETLTNSDGSATFVEIPGGPLSFDACGITDYGVSITEVNCGDLGTPVTITVFAADASGNSAVCTSTVTVIDLLAPIITCPADQTVDPGVGNLFYEVPDYIGTGEAIADDNCSDPVTITTQDPAAGSLVSDGTYTITITGEDASGNVGTCSFELTVESVLGVESNELNNAISMYPNPAQDRVTISNSSNIQLETAVIFDLNGKMINQIDLSTMQGEQVINISDLASGVYVVQLTSDTSSVTKRLIKE